jgi:hypothetical protein
MPKDRILRARLVDLENETMDFQENPKNKFIDSLDFSNLSFFSQKEDVEAVDGDMKVVVAAFDGSGVIPAFQPSGAISYSINNSRNAKSNDLSPRPALLYRAGHLPPGDAGEAAAHGSAEQPSVRGNQGGRLRS